MGQVEGSVFDFDGWQGLNKGFHVVEGIFDADEILLWDGIIGGFGLNFFDVGAPHGFFGCFTDKSAWFLFPELDEFGEQGGFSDDIGVEDILDGEEEFRAFDANGLHIVE